MDAEDVEAWIPFWGIVGVILTMGPGFLGDFLEDPLNAALDQGNLEQARMEPRHGALLVPLLAIISAIAFM